MIVYFEKMALKRDVRSYFSAKGNESKRSRIPIPEIIITATNNDSQAEVDMAKEEVIGRNQLQDKSTKMYQRKSLRKSGDML